MLVSRLLSAAHCYVVASLLLLLGATPASSGEISVDINGASFVNYGLVGVGRVPASLRNNGETFGSGSGMVFDGSSWKRTAGGYKGILFLLPDRGYNGKGTVVDYQARINRLAITFTPVAPDRVLPANKAQQSVQIALGRPIFLRDGRGQPFTSLDATRVRKGTPDLPQAANGRISIDPEGIARARNGTFYVSEEYGPYVYTFSPDGRLRGVTAPPDAFIPLRNGRKNFSAEDPDPNTGRVNNRGLEGLSLTPDGKYLVAVLQSPTIQDGGKTSRYTRALVYEVTKSGGLRLVREHAIELPEYTEEGHKGVAAQSEILALSDSLLLMLCRDGKRGYGTGQQPSLYRKVGIIDLSQARPLAKDYGRPDRPISPGGKLEKDIAVAKFIPFIDLNDEGELRRFGLHNDGDPDCNMLSEKWESLGLVGVLDPNRPDDFFLFVGNDNDFITQYGHQAGKDYRDRSGVEVDTMLLVFHVRLPGLRGVSPG